MKGPLWGWSKARKGANGLVEKSEASPPPQLNYDALLVQQSLMSHRIASMEEEPPDVDEASLSFSPIDFWI